MSKVYVVSQFEEDYDGRYREYVGTFGVFASEGEADLSITNQEVVDQDFGDIYSYKIEEFEL